MERDQDAVDASSPEVLPMPEAVIHPPPHELTAFGLGKLPEHAAAVVAAHLESCAACRQAVAAVLPDSFLDKVRATGPAGSSFPPALAGAGNAPSSAGRSAIPPVACPNIPPELANHPRYLILRELGRGGMGVVYQARHKEMDRQVVVKVINRALLDRPDALERFRREIRAAAQLSHPNIVTAYDAEQAGESHMLVMEFVPGQSLAEVLQKKGPLPVAIACYFARQVALGLQHAQEHGLVHRDIKPQNLMLTPKGQVKILDFGLAKVMREEGASTGMGTGLTSHNACMGTPDYCAPEQVQDARTADIRADLYSLGCTLYCLLAGRPPFREDTAMKTLLAHLQKAPQPLPELRPEVPAELWQVVKCLLAKEPSQRYQTPTEVAQALAPFINPGAKQEAKGGSVFSHGVGSPARGTMIEADTSAIKEILRGVPGKASPKKMPAREKEASRFADLTGAGAAPKEVVRACEEEQPSPVAWWKRPGMQAAAVGVSLALILMAVIIIKIKMQTPNGDTGKVMSSKDSTGKSKPPPAEVIVVLEIDQPGAEVFVDGQKIKVNVPGDSEPIEIGVESGQHKLRITKAGFVAVTKEIELTAGKSKPIRIRLESEPPPERPIEANKSKEEKQKTKTELPSREQDLSAIRVFQGHEGKITHVLFAPDGSRLVSASSTYRDRKDEKGQWRDPGRDNSVRVWSIISGKEMRKFLVKESFDFPIQGIALSPDGRLAAACTSWYWGGPPRNPRVYVWDIITGVRKHLLTPSGNRAMRAVGFSADGALLFALRGSPGLHSYSLADGKEVSRIDLANQNPNEVPLCTKLSTDCRFVIGASWQKSVRLWDRETGKEAMILEGHEKVPTSVALSPDGSRVLSCADDLSVRLWDMKTGQQIWCLNNLKSAVLCLAFSPDGKRFLTGEVSGAVRLRDTLTGNEVARLLGHTAQVNCVAFSSAGDQAASGSDDTTIRLWQLPAAEGR